MALIMAIELWKKEIHYVECKGMDDLVDKLIKGLDNKSDLFKILN